MAADYKKKGLVVVGVTDEEEKLVAEYIDKHGVEFPVAHLASGEFEAAIGVQGFPTAAIIDPKGELVWKGHPASSDGEVKTHVKGSKRTPLLPEALEGAEKYLDKDEYGPAFRELQRVLAGEDLQGQDRTTAEQLAAYIERKADRLVNAARDALGDQDWYTASLHFETLAAQYEGVGPDGDARKKLEEWKKDKAVQEEIKAGEKMAEARELEAQILYDKAWTRYRSIAKKYKDTTTGAKAEARAAELKDGGYLGMEANCQDCLEAARACERHAR